MIRVCVTPVLVEDGLDVRALAQVYSEPSLGIGGFGVPSAALGGVLEQITIFAINGAVRKPCIIVCVSWLECARSENWSSLQKISQGAHSLMIGQTDVQERQWRNL